MAIDDFIPAQYPRLRTHVRTRKCGKQVTYYFWDGRGVGIKDIPLGTDPQQAIEAWRRCENGLHERVRPKGKRKARWSDDIPLWARQLYLGAETRSKANGRDFTLTIADLSALIVRANGKCELSGIDLVVNADEGHKPFSPSLDRIDSSKGYTPDNVRIVCYIANVAMNAWGAEPLFFLAKHLNAERESGTTRNVAKWQHLQASRNPHELVPETGIEPVRSQ